MESIPLKFTQKQLSRRILMDVRENIEKDFISLVDPCILYSIHNNGSALSILNNVCIWILVLCAFKEFHRADRFTLFIV